MANVPTDPPVSRTIDYGALVKKLLGDEFHKHEDVYKLSNGRKFESSDYGTQGIYGAAPTIVRTGTAQSGGTNHIVLGTDANGSAHDYVGKTITLTGGLGVGLTATIVAYNEDTKSANIVPPWGPDYISLPGSGGNYASTPDTAEISQVGDQDIRIKVSLSDWIGPGYFLWNRMATGTDRGVRIGVNVSGGMRFEWSVDGLAGTLVLKDSTVVLPASDGDTLWLRWVLDVDNGAGGYDVKFYTSDDGESWTQLGSTVTTAGSTSVFNPTGLPALGAVAGENHHKIYAFQVLDGIDGTVVAKFDPHTATSRTATSLTSTTGEVWTINQSGSPAAEMGGAYAIDSTSVYSISA